MGALLRVALCLAGCALGQPVAAAIYAHTGDDGAVTLSNVPVGDGYTILVGQDGDPAASGQGPGRDGRSGHPARRAAHDAVIDEAAQLHGLDKALLHAVVAVESGYDADATSTKGARGLMQLMPATARRYGVTNIDDPRQNLLGGARYLRDLLRLFNEDLGLALAAYNAGENRVLRNGKRIPQIRETLDYVPKVLDLYQRFRAQGYAPPGLGVGQGAPQGRWDGGP